MFKDEFSGQVNPWHDADFSSDIFLANCPQGVYNLAEQEGIYPVLISYGKLLLYLYLVFENRVSKDNDSFYYFPVKSNKIRPKAD